MHKSSIFTALLLLSACSEPSQTTGGEATAQPEAKPIALSETGKGEGVDFTVTSVKTVQQFDSTGLGPKAADGETFVVVGYTIKNTSGETLGLIARPEIELMDGTGKVYAPDVVGGISAATMTGDTSGMAADLNPGVSASSATAWKVLQQGFDKATWKVVVKTDPPMTFALQ